MSLRVKIAVTEEEKRLSYRMRFEMMCRDLGWLPVQDYAVPEERDEYDEKQSVIFLALDDYDNAVGTVRLILPGHIPLPVEKYFDLPAKEAIEATHGKITMGPEVSRFIVPHNENYKRHEITGLLCLAVIRWLKNAGASHLYVSADHRFFRLLAMLGFCVDPIAESKEYMGSKTIPGITSIGQLEQNLRIRKPDMYVMLVSAGELTLNIAA